MEMRGTDSGPWRRLCALPALWTGVSLLPLALLAVAACVKAAQLPFQAWLLGAEGRRGSRALH